MMKVLNLSPSVRRVRYFGVIPPPNPSVRPSIRRLSQIGSPLSVSQTLPRSITLARPIPKTCCKLMSSVGAPRMKYGRCCAEFGEAAISRNRRLLQGSTAARSPSIRGCGGGGRSDSLEGEREKEREREREREGRGGRGKKNDFFLSVRGRLTV